MRNEAVPEPARNFEMRKGMIAKDLPIQHVLFGHCE